jgi:hypothetical protein
MVGMRESAGLGVQVAEVRGQRTARVRVLWVRGFGGAASCCGARVSSRARDELLAKPQSSREYFSGMHRDPAASPVGSPPRWPASLTAVATGMRSPPFAGVWTWESRGAAFHHVEHRRHEDVRTLVARCTHCERARS